MKTSHKVGLALAVGGALWWLLRDDDTRGPVFGEGDEAPDDKPGEKEGVSALVQFDTANLGGTSRDERVNQNAYCDDPNGQPMTYEQSSRRSRLLKKTAKKLGYERGGGKHELEKRTFFLTRETIRKFCPALALPPKMYLLDNFLAADWRLAHIWPDVADHAYQFNYGAWD